MTKHITLSVLAVLSLALSYFYEIAPAKSATPEPVALAPTITPYTIHSPEDVVKALELKLPDPAPVAPKAEVEEGFYSRRLGLHFDTNKNKRLVQTAAKWLGTPYRYGSSSKSGTDCSGFVSRIYREVYGIDLSRSSRSMFADVHRVKRDKMRTGDLVFFRRSPKEPIFHVGIYLKNNKFIHAATNGGVRVSSLKESFYRNNFYAAGRVM
ncbi:C40 family peptidase [Pontibacter sp. 172403-2]|uniref:C40 family peptidase n=1 Tax=Pontibacter rufus TaxID=2791028 RepID=UPI0018AF7B29|nr:NlpC/P60 family protein [Pontibacter sp. 172403-2]MBF9251693.1 C40 family peptidase [Pontibacter sp. 172403-2]